VNGPEYKFRPYAPVAKTSFEKMSEAVTMHYEAELDRRLGVYSPEFRAALQQFNDHLDEVFMANLTGDERWRSEMWLGRS